MNCSKHTVSSWPGEKDILFFNHILINWGMAVLWELPAAGRQHQQNKSHVLNLEMLFFFLFWFLLLLLLFSQEVLCTTPWIKAFDLKSGGSQ